MTHPNSDCSQQARQEQIDRNPFVNLKISDSSVLNCLEGRRACPKCGKSRKYFCYSCCVPVAELDGKLPHVRLPIKVDIIKHRNEIDGKSTACHAAILAHEDVRMYTYPDIPEYEADGVVLIFPSATAKTVQQLIRPAESDEQDEPVRRTGTGTLMKELRGGAGSEGAVPMLAGCLPVRRAVFIDSTWNQSRGIYKDERIRRLPCVVIQSRVSQFWRHQRGSPRWYLATIEAVHQFLVEVHAGAWGVAETYAGLEPALRRSFVQRGAAAGCTPPYDGQYDDLLFFFRHMYELIHAYYQHDALLAYRRRLT